MALSTTVTLAFSLELTTDPLGATLDVGVPDAPSEESRQALLDNIERSLVGAQGNLVFQAVQQAHGALDDYGSENDYATEPIEASFAGVEADRDQTSIHVEWAWSHEAAGFFEFGVSPHTIDGSPLLHFYWEEIGQWIQTESVNWGSETGGIPEGRWVRDSMHWFRRQVGQ